MISKISPGTDLNNATPIYKDLSPFKDDFTGENSKELNDFINLIEEECKTKVSIIAFGPERSQVKFLKKFLLITDETWSWMTFSFFISKT